MRTFYTSKLVSGVVWLQPHNFKTTRLVAAIVCLFIQQLINAQWPQWRGPMRDGSSTEVNLLKTWPADGPKLVWTSDTIGDGYASAIIQDKIIYVAGTKDSAEIITAFDLNRDFYDKITPSN